MSTLDDLKQSLAEHAPETDHDLAARPGAVASRVAAVRRRRTAAGATLAAAVVAGAAVAATTLPSGGDRAPAPAKDPTTSAPTEPAPRGEVTFSPEAGGYRLQASMLAEPGVRELERSTVLPAHVQFAVHCSTSADVESGPRMPWVTIEVQGWQVLQVSCGSGGSPYDDPAAYLYGPDAGDGAPGLTVRRTAGDGTERERHIDAGTNVTFTVRLTDQQGRAYAQPVSDVELGLGIYAR